MNDDRTGVAGNEDLDEPEEEDPQASPQLREAVEQLLARARSAGRRRGASHSTTDQDRLGRLLDCSASSTTSATRSAARSPAKTRSHATIRSARTRRSARAFVCHCADRLAEIAAAAIDFAIELAASFENHKLNRPV